MTKRIFLYGASGHGKVIMDIAEAIGLSVDFFVDDDESISEFNGVQVIRKLDFYPIQGVLAIGNNESRKSLAFEISEAVYPHVIHPRANVSNKVEIGEGTLVMAGATINAGVCIGSHVIVNTNSSIDHDCEISDFVHVSPNAALSGNVFVGEGTHVGIGASIIQGIKIGKWATLGAGAVIIKDVPDYAVVVGNPGRIIKYNRQDAE